MNVIIDFRNFSQSSLSATIAHSYNLILYWLSSICKSLYYWHNNEGLSHTNKQGFYQHGWAYPLYLTTTMRSSGGCLGWRAACWQPNIVQNTVACCLFTDCKLLIRSLSIWHVSLWNWPDRHVFMLCLLPVDLIMECCLFGDGCDYCCIIESYSPSCLNNWSKSNLLPPLCFS